MSKARELASLGNAYSDGSLSNRNKIINGSFTVSQRGDYTTATAVSNNAYSVDRWKDWSSIAVTHQNASVTINGKTYKSLKVSATASSASANIGARQFVEGINLISGETYTVHCYIRTNSASARLRTYRLDGVAGLQTDPIPSDGEWHKAELTTTYSGSINPEIGAIIYGDEAGASISAGDYVEFALVQLEVGDTATPFEHRSYGQELALCQRYYWRPMSKGAASVPILRGYVVNGTQIGTTVMFPTTMRAAPSIHVLGTWTAVKAGQPTISNQTIHGVELFAVGTTTGTGIVYPETSDDGIELDAEL